MIVVGLSCSMLCLFRCREHQSSITVTRSGWGTTSSCVIAMACARRCNGRSIAMAAFPAADHGFGVRVRGGQCRGAEPFAVIIIELDEAADRGAALPARIRPRHTAFSLSLEPQGHRLSPHT